MASPNRKPVATPHADRKQQPPSIRRTISLPLLVGTIVALMVLLPGLYFWRLRQVERGADVYLERAESLAKEEEWAQSADYLFLYLRLRPDDVAARIQLAETYDRVGNKRPHLARAIELYYQALAKAPADEQRPLRLRLAELLIQNEQFAAAQVEANALLKLNAEDPQAHQVRALALYGAAKSGGLDAVKSDGENVTKTAPAEVGAALEEAFRLNPANVTVAATLVDVYRRQPELQSAKVRELSNEQRAALADQCLDELVKAAPQEASAFLARFQDRLTRSGAEAAAEADLQQALQLAPANPVVLIAAADLARRKGTDATAKAEEKTKELQAAGEYYERALQAVPTLDRAYAGLGEIQLRQNERDRAIKTWELGLEKCGRENIALNMLLAEELITEGELERAAKYVEQLKATAFGMRQRGFLESQLEWTRGAELLDAQLQLAKGNTAEAIEILKRIAGGLKGNANTGLASYQASMMLGGIYDTQNQPELALGAYEDAASAQPTFAEPHLALARSLFTRDQADLAVESLRKAVSLDNSAANQVLLVGGLLQAQLKRQPAERDWSPLETSLADARRTLAEAKAAELWQLSMLEAAYRFQRESSTKNRQAGIDAALSVLRETEKLPDLPIEALANFADAYERYDAAADTDRVIAQLRSRFPENSRSHLVAANVLAARKQFEPARGALAAGLKAVSEDQRLPLRLASVHIDALEGRNEQAWAAQSELQREHPKDREVLEQLLEFALEFRKLSDAEELEQRFQKMPGVSELDWKTYRARRLIVSATGPQDEKLVEAEQLLAEISKQRPNSASGHLLQGELMEQRGNLEQAVTAFQQAIQLGEQRLIVYERLILLLYKLDRYSEANQYLTKLQDLAPSSTGLSTLEIASALRNGNSDRALDFARRGVAQRPSDPLAHVWLGQLLLTANKPAEAEQSLQLAIELAPTDPRTQGAMMYFLVRTRQLDRARSLLQEFANRLKLSPARKALLLAAGYEAIGDRDEAISQLHEAEKLDPQDARVHERVGIALLRRDGEAAEKSLRRALELDPNSAAARRGLAELLTNRGGEKNWQAAIALLRDGNAGGAPAHQDKRLQAIVLARRGGADNLAKACELIEGTLKDPSTTSRADRYLLAQLREAQGKSDLAGEAYLKLASETSALPAHIAAYADWLIRQNRSKEAATWLDKLEQIDPNNLATVRLRVRWLQAAGQEARIETVLEKTAERLLRENLAGATPSEAQKLETCLTVGDLYFSVKQYAAAERWYGRAYAIDAKEYGRLARCVAEQGQIAKAIELCTLAEAKSHDHVPATTLAQILIQCQPSAEQLSLAAPALEKALAKHQDQPDLLTAMATLRVIQQKPDEAGHLYRRVVDLQPNNVDALNNLATVLAEQGNQDAEALSYIERAIEIVGPQPNLLDTKGTILLTLNKVDEAVSILNAAASVPDPDPRFLFHLAVGHYRAGDLPKARKALDSARTRDLDRSVLTGSDARLLAELNDKLN